MPAPPTALDALIGRLMARPYMRDLFGIELVDYARGAVTLQLAHRPELGHQPGWFQGAVTTAIGEYAAAMSGSTMVPERDSTTLQQSIHFTGPARGDRLVAVGRVIAAGARISTTAAEVYVERDGERHSCASLTMTMAHRDLPVEVQP